MSRKRASNNGPKVKKDFDLEVVEKGFKECRMEDGSIRLTEYLQSFSELCRFFHLSGRIFSFVAKDLDGKMSIIKRRMSSKEGDKYVTVQGMMEYEIENKITHLSGHNGSGTRALLRLQRALEFIITFMKDLSASTDDTPVSRVAADVYSRTLSHHHPWLVRRVAGLAMYMLPNRRQLIDIMCKHDADRVWVLTDRVVEVATVVYDDITHLYEQHQLLHIP